MFISSVTIPVNDQDRALKFYTEKLGFTVKLDIPCPELHQRWIELVHPGSSIELVLFTSEDFESMLGKNMNVMYTTHDIQKMYAELISKGVEILEPPKAEFWGSHMTMRDSEGNMFCISQTNGDCEATAC